MAQDPITSTLFRFVNTRNPQLLNRKEKEIGFIYYPEPQLSESAFLPNLPEDRDERRNELNSRTATFNSLQSIQNVENVKPDLYEFAMWLMRNKNSLINEEVVSKSAEVRELTSLQEKRIWDNLLYQIISKKSDVVREALVIMLVANNFIKLNDYNTRIADKLINSEKEVERLANAYVVIPKSVMNNFEIQSQQRRNPNLNEYRVLNEELRSFKNERRLEQLDSAISEIKNVITQNDFENASKLKEAQSKYDSNLERAYANAKQVKDPETGEITYENLEVPELDFTHNKISDGTYLESKVSEKTKHVYNEVTLKEFKSDEEILEYLENQANKLASENLSLDKNEVKTVRYKGIPITAKKTNVPSLSYALSSEYADEDKNKINSELLLTTGYENANITGVDLTITFDDKSKLKQPQGGFKNGSGDSLIISTYPVGITVPSGVKSFSLSGKIILDYENEVEISTRSVVIGGDMVNGRAKDSKLAQDKPTIKHYGISNLGIGDFMRVDQEVCCYVPGEVSRIENILAREYKERTTRSLLSSETTTEETSELEVENLTDTSTSERNELSSEVSSIVNKDKSENFGASAGVSGTIYGVDFFANGFYNGASATSTSNSYNEAQTYAEEVTERALERVVQKVTKKRTSRILREFEENNSHGFDNTGGDSHVTGVYRWVDKIYTNKLINYGKRLMYEFTVPEPSKYFKHAIIQAAESGATPYGVPDGVVLPQLPPNPTIGSATYVTRFTYLGFASLYNVAVTPPLPIRKKITKSFSHKFREEDQGHEERMLNSRDFSLDIPEGYYCDKVNVRGMIVREGDSGHLRANAYIGGKKFNVVHTTSGTPRMEFNETLTLSEKFYEELTLGMTFEDVEPLALTIVAFCKVNDEETHKWQNETYATIMNAYKEQLQAYNDALYANYVPPSPEPEETSINFNEKFNRLLEKRELKRLAVDMLARPFGIVTAKDNYHYNSLTNIRLSAQLDEHAQYVKFLEQAFDWEIMSYIFYPYYYANKSKWDELFQESNGVDAVFQAFLQSGMSRMVVPVRPGFEKAVAYFLETGDVYVGDNLAIDRDDDLYLSIAEELETTEGKVEKEWETRVPTTLTILQSDTAPLNETGLPCCHNEDETKNLAHGTSVMIGKPTEPQS